MGSSRPTAGVDDAQPESIETEGTVMRERRVGIRELRSRLSDYLGEVRAGTTIVVTDHGRQVARIVPQVDSSERTLAALRSAGTIMWSGRRLKNTKPSVRVRGAGSVSDLVIENRR